MSPTLSLPDFNDASHHSPVPGVKYYWLREGRIFVVELQDVTQQAVDAYVEVVNLLIDTYPQDRSVLQLNNFDFPGFVMTPYLRSKVTSIPKNAEKRESHSYIAILQRHSITNQIMQIFMAASARINPSRVNGKIFNDYPKALAWLESHIQEDNDPEDNTQTASRTG